MTFVNVYRKDTGEKVRVPARWVDTPLFAPFRKTPKQRATTDDDDKPAAAPTGKDK